MAVVDRCEIDESAFSGPRPLAFSHGGPRDLIVGKIRTEPLVDEVDERGGA
jgi:hypothetical protein